MDFNQVMQQKLVQELGAMTMRAVGAETQVEVLAKQIADLQAQMNTNSVEAKGAA